MTINEKGRPRRSKREDRSVPTQLWTAAIVRWLETPLGENNSLQLSKDLFTAAMFPPTTWNRLLVTPTTRVGADFDRLWRTKRQRLQREMRQVAMLMLSDDTIGTYNLPLRVTALSVMTGTIGSKPGQLLVLSGDIRSALLLSLAVGLRRDPGVLPLLRRCVFPSCPYGLEGPRFFVARGKTRYCSPACSNRHRQRKHYKKEKEAAEKVLKQIRRTRSGKGG